MKFAFRLQFHYFNVALTLCHIKSDPLPPHLSFKLCSAPSYSCSEQTRIRPKVNGEQSQPVLVFMLV